MTDILDLSGKELEKELDKIAQGAVRYRFWTPKEDEILIRLYERGVPLGKIAEALGRTMRSIDARLTTLQTKRRRP